MAKASSLPLPDAPTRWAQLAGLHWGLLGSALALSAIGLVTVGSAAAELGGGYLFRQLVWVGAGLVAMLVALAIDYQRLLAWSTPLYAGALAALLLVLPLGHRAGGSVGWFRVGSVGLQPSEFAKLATALVLASYLAGESERHLTPRQLVRVLALALVPMLLIVVQPDLGGAAMFVPMVAGVLLVAGIQPRLLVTGALAAMLLGALVWGVGMKPYQRQRVTTFLQPASDPLGAGYQVRQSKIAVGSGQLTGRGYRQGTQSQLRFLPARHTDFIFAVLAEERGFAGVALVLVLYGAFFTSAATVAARARDRAGVLLVVALAGIAGFHVLYNTAMVIGLVPITGIPLPFLSYGGSFTLVNWIAVGLILNVDYRRYVNR
ncbi:MAG: rod shape-determining protein RodA [Thermoanaerobaculia bacterium]|nr:rod shape-determining protein RodA [Thermoanaerobaculia bacterium]